MGHHGLDTDESVFFYEQEFYVLSNFSSFSIIMRTDPSKSYRKSMTVFPTAEHCYHWHKFADPTIRNTILHAISAHDAFTYARMYKEHVRSDWNDVRLTVMETILRLKVSQHEYVFRKLHQTGKRLLVENSWRDDFWGIGPNKDGQNHLGKLWMKIRDDYT